MTAWTGVRYREDVGWELRCAACSSSKVDSYWPLTMEFWIPKKGMTRCRACWNAYVRSRRRRPAGAVSEAIRRYQRDWARRKREQDRADEGRTRYQRRAA